MSQDIEEGEQIIAVPCLASRMMIWQLMAEASPYGKLIKEKGLHLKFNFVMHTQHDGRVPAPDPKTQGEPVPAISTTSPYCSAKTTWIFSRVRYHLFGVRFEPQTGPEKARPTIRL